MKENAIGSLVFAVPAVALAVVVLWRRYKPVFWAVCAMIIFATGYLNLTGATRDIAAAVGAASRPVPGR